MLFIVHLILIIRLVESVEQTDIVDDFFAGPKKNDVGLDRFVCPKGFHKVPFFGFKCKTNEDCIVPGELCCQQKNFKICRRGVQKKQPKPDIKFKSGDSQIRTRRLCPSREAFIEMLPIQNCTDDTDCGLWRICCPDGEFSYCRRAVPQLDLIFSSEIVKSSLVNHVILSYATRIYLTPENAKFIFTHGNNAFNNVMSYLQCTSPPPPPLDFFAKPCKNVLDCFPNLCCQEQGRKVCRPSRRSIFPYLTLLT